MSILSIDVGIKNLAYCLLDEHCIYKWGVVSLVENEKHICIDQTMGKNCTNESKFTKNSNHYCLKHAKKESFIIPSQEISPSYIKKMDILKLKALADKYSINHDMKLKKKGLQQEVIDFFKTNCFETIQKVSASDVDLITIGRSLKKEFDLLFNQNEIDCVIIENQISPIANRMKTLQGMISQYFIMRNPETKIEFVSSVNKLKDNVYIQLDKQGCDKLFNDEPIDKVDCEKLTYNQRKKLGVKRCGELIKNKNYTEWYQFFLNHKKKDDLSDSFLQGLWYIHQNKC